MKKMMLGMMALCAVTAFGDIKIGTVDMMVLVRNHKSYDTNKKMLQDSEKDYQKELDEVKSELDALQDEGKKVADQGRNPMLSQAQKDKIEKELLDIQNKFVAGQQKLRTKAMESQQKLQEFESRLLKATTEDIRAVVNKFAADNGYDLIIESTVTAFAKKSFDVTDGILKEMGIDLSFCKDPKHIKLVESTKASVVLLPPEWDKGAPCTVIRVVDPNHACMTAAKMFAPPEPVRAPGVHPSAVVDSSVKLGKNVHVGPFTVIEKGAEIGDGAVIEAQVFIGEGCKVGAKTHIYPQVTLREGTIVGSECIIHCGVRLGGDGYGFNNGRREDGSVYIEKIPQLGIVEIGDGVEIGSNTTIDRARIGRTYIGPMTKIDNRPQRQGQGILGAHRAVRHSRFHRDRLRLPYLGAGGRLRPYQDRGRRAGRSAGRRSPVARRICQVRHRHAGRVHEGLWRPRPRSQDAREAQGRGQGIEGEGRREVNAALRLRSRRTREGLREVPRRVRGFAVDKGRQDDGLPRLRGEDPAHHTGPRARALEDRSPLPRQARGLSFAQASGQGRIREDVLKGHDEKSILRSRARFDADSRRVCRRGGER